jgi:putative hydrolase of HD superfamily
LECGLKEKFNEYFSDRDYAKHEKRILAAAHCLSTKWEFGVLYPWNSMLYGIEKTRQEIDETIASYDDLTGIRKLIINKRYYGFLDLCGQLRFQQRWAQAFRIPKTTVLGHMFTVAVFSFLLSVQINVCRKRKYNNFFSSLFHDLPEILTKDIISPVKTSIEGLGNIIKQYEKKQVEERILPLIPENWRDEMTYFIEYEFVDKIMEHGKIKKVENAGDFDEDKFNAVDGSLKEVCDKFCAYIEASMSLEYGIKSDALSESKRKLYDFYSSFNKNGIEFKQLFDYFL